MTAPRVCGDCGCPVEFIPGTSGRPIAVVKVKTIYMKVRAREGTTLRPTSSEDGSIERYVPHSQTCPVGATRPGFQ